MAKIVADTTKDTLGDFILDNVEKVSTVNSNAHSSLAGLEGLRYELATVKRSTNQYVPGQAHTYGNKSFWSLMKRGLSCVPHWVSVIHLPVYVDGFVQKIYARALH